MKSFLNILSISICVLAFGSAIWIIVPAPSYYVWLFSVAASEWSLWIAALASIGIICALLSRIRYKTKNVWIISTITACAAIGISLYPLFSVRDLARRQNVSLSFSRYFSSLRRGENKKDFTTYTFARIDEKDLRLDFYKPAENASNKGASVIVIHGGSWNGGARNDFPNWNERLAAEGFAVFDIDYRLAPQPNYLSATGDVKCAVKWIKARAAEFNISPERIALLGRSAGGHLALLAAYSAGDTRLPATCADIDQNENVRAVVSFYAPTDLIWAFDNPANQLVIDGPAAISNFVGGSPFDSAESKERFALASPVARVSANTPPTLLIHGGQDQLVRSGNMFLLDDALTKANIIHRTIFIPYAQHGFDYNINGFGSQISEPLILDFLHENTNLK